MNFTRFIASILCMLGLSTGIGVYIREVSLINLFHVIFFNLIGILLLYKGLEKKEVLE